MCDILGCCDKTRPKYEWLPDEQSPNREAIEALRRQQYSRDIELPERVERVGRPGVSSSVQKRYDAVLDLGSVNSTGAALNSTSGSGGGGGSVYKYGDNLRDDPAPPRAPPLAPSGEGQRLGGGSTGQGVPDDADAAVKIREAALKRMDSAPKGFSAAGAKKLKGKPGFY